MYERLYDHILGSLAVAGMEYDYGMAYIAELMRRSKMPTPEELRRSAPELLSHLRM